MLSVSFLYRNGIIRDDQITSSLTAVCHSGHSNNYLSVAGTAVQFTNAHKPPHPVQTCHPIATKNKYVINTIWQHTTLQLLLLTCLTTQRAIATYNLVDVIYTSLGITKKNFIIGLILHDRGIL